MEVDDARSRLLTSTDDVFASSDALVVRQLFEVVEALGIEVRNRYVVTTEEAIEGEKDVREANETVAMYVEERSDCLERVCCRVCRAMKMSVHVGRDRGGAVAIEVERAWSCKSPPWPFCFHVPAWFIFCPYWACASREACMPRAVIKDENGDVLGEVVVPFRNAFCCEIYATVRDENGDDVFVLGPTSQMCTKGCCCPCLEDEEIAVYDGRDVSPSDLSSASPVATVTRLALSGAECVCCGKFNRFRVSFGAIKDVRRRKLLFGVAMFMDVTFWEPE